MAYRSILGAVACGLTLTAGSILQATAIQEVQPKTAPASQATADSPNVRFSGEVLRGQIYEHDVGHNMIFRLTPAVSDEGGGWVIGMLPSVEPADEPLEFVEIATPPYHGYNDRYLAATAGYSAREAVAVTTRKFYFVESVADEHIASEVVNAELYPSTVSDDEKARIGTEGAKIYLGSGEFRIVHSRIAPGKGGEPDTIASLKFDVVLHFSPDITLQSVLAPHAPSARR